MSDNLVLEMLRVIRGDLADLKADGIEVKSRLGILEQQYASLSNRIDRLSGDVVTIRRRLELHDEAAV
jgi:predicted nuclease with TOPRIM domain